MTEIDVTQRDLADLFPAMEEPDEEIVLLSLIEPVEASPNADLRRSLEERGQLVPIILNAPEDSSEPYRLIDGRRRVAALRAAGVNQAVARVYRVDPLVEAALAATANAVRSDNPENELEAIERLSAAGFDDAQIARATGMHLSSIRKRRRLEVLPDDLRAAVKSGQVAMGIAQRMVKLPATQQERLVAHFRDTGQITGADVSSVGTVARIEAVRGLADLFDAPEDEAAPEDQLKRSMMSLAQQYPMGRIAFARLAREAWEASRA